VTRASSDFLLVHPEALDEFAEAAAWYETEVVGLGTQFQASVRVVLESLRDGPRTRSPLMLEGRTTPYRVRRPRRFPFRVIYREVPRGVLVVAVAHMRRRPGYWLARDE